MSQPSKVEMSHSASPVAAGSATMATDAATSLMNNDDLVEVALRNLERADGWPADSLWIAPDASGHAAIWAERGPDDLLHCVGHVAGQRFVEFIAAAAMK